MDDKSGLGNLLSPDTLIQFATAVADHAPGIANMFNATGNSDDVLVRDATQTMVYLQCWAHVQRAVDLLTC